MSIGVTGIWKNIKKYTSSHSMREKIQKLGEKIKKFGVATIVTATMVACLAGVYINSLMPIRDAYVFTNPKSEYQICQVLGTGDIKDCISGKPFVDENGTQCRYNYGIYWEGTNERIGLGDKEKLIKEGISAEDAKKTYLSDIAGIPLEKVLPEDVLTEVGTMLTEKEVRIISEEIDQYMLEYLKQDSYPTYTCFDHYEQYGDERELTKCPSLYIYQGIDEKGRKTGEVVVGYATWYNKEETSTRHFHDITNNQLRSIRDKNGNTRYQCIESVRGKKNETDPITRADLDAKRLRYWGQRHPDYADDEFEPLFGDEIKKVSVDDIEQIANEDQSIQIKMSVIEHLEQAKRGTTQVEMRE